MPVICDSLPIFWVLRDLGCLTFPVLLSAAHTPLVSSPAKANSIPNLLLFLAGDSWSWLQQYSGISTASKVVPSCMVSPDLSSGISILPHSAKAQDSL